MGVQSIERIEDKIDKVAAGSTGISMSMGGVQFTSMIELMEFSKLMSVSGCAVPTHLRGNPGACLAVCTKALRFGFDPFSLAEHSYAMEKSIKVDNQWQKIETIAYDSFVIRAIIQAHAKITGQLEYSYEGDGDARTCTVTAEPSAGGKKNSHKSPTLGKLKEARGKNDAGKIKGSPLWETKPDVQLGYDTGRDFCRLYHPEILLGWYDRDEMEEYSAGTVEAKATPQVGSRLKGQKNRGGFNEDGVQKALAHAPGAVLPIPSQREKAATVTAGASAEAITPVAAIEAQFELVTDPATEIEAKKKAVANCETVEDVRALIASTTEYLKAEKRSDMLADFLSVADKRIKAIAKKNAPATPAEKKEF